MTIHKAGWAILLATLTPLTTAIAAETVKFQRGVDGYAGASDVEIRGGKAIPDPPKPTPAKAETPKKSEAPKKAETPKKAEAAKPAESPTAADKSISIDLDNDAMQSQALIRFADIIGNGRGQIPAGSTITAAVLTINGNNKGGGRIYVHRVLADWDPAKVTWDSAKLADNTEGGIQGDLKEAMPSFTSFASNKTGPIEVDVLPAVELWAAGTAKNFGLALTSDNGNGWDFDTSECPEVEKRPRLTVTYTPPAAR